MQAHGAWPRRLVYNHKVLPLAALVFGKQSTVRVGFTRIRKSNRKPSLRHCRAGADSQS
jgi:hypothetical protein